MPERMGLAVPIVAAQYQWEYRNTGDDWTFGGVMRDGVHNRTIGFTAPACDELRLRAVGSSVSSANRVHLAGLSISEGLTFDIDGTVIAQPTITRPSETNHFTFRFDPVNESGIELVITGLAQRKLDIRQFFFAKLEWQPDRNYDNESAETSGVEYLDQTTRSSNYQNKVSGGRSLSLSFSLQTEETMLDLLHLEKNLTNQGFCLFERDADSAEVRQDYCFAVNLRVGETTPTAFNKYTINTQMKEAFEQ